MKLLALALTVLVVSCSSTSNNSRKIASQGPDLTGNYLAVGQYEFGHKGPNKAANRIYFHPVEGKSDTYDVVIVEYANLFGIAPKYIASNKLPWVSNKIGYLNHISRNASAYEATPGKTPGTYELFPLVVIGDQILPDRQVSPRILTLSQNAKLPNPLEGATISTTNQKDLKEIFFPKKDDKRISGLQFATSKFVYHKAKLDSTWRKNFLKGPYLAQYGKKDDVVLTLSEKDGANLAQFSLGNVGKMSEEKRKKVFTNAKSAGLEGKFKVTEPRDGMFLLHGVDPDAKTEGVVEGRIGLFVDVFDATKSLNQDVVELIFTNTDDPEDFLMYYEHPGNGEGN